MKQAAGHERRIRELHALRESSESESTFTDTLSAQTMTPCPSDGNLEELESSLPTPSKGNLAELESSLNKDAGRARSLSNDLGRVEDSMSPQKSEGSSPRSRPPSPCAPLPASPTPATSPCASPSPPAGGLASPPAPQPPLSLAAHKPVVLPKSRCALRHGESSGDKSSHWSESEGTEFKLRGQNYLTVLSVHCNDRNLNHSPSASLMCALDGRMERSTVPVPRCSHCWEWTALPPRSAMRTGAPGLTAVTVYHYHHQFCGCRLRSWWPCMLLTAMRLLVQA